LQPRFFLFQVYKKIGKFSPKKLSKLVEFALEKHTSKVGLKGGSKVVQRQNYPLLCIAIKRKGEKKNSQKFTRHDFFSAAQPSPAQNHPKRGWELEPRLGSPPLPCHEKKDPVTNMTTSYTGHG
jgi:hypothetical protein